MPDILFRQSNLLIDKHLPKVDGILRELGDFTLSKVNDILQINLVNQQNLL